MFRAAEISYLVRNLKDSRRKARHDSSFARKGQGDVLDTLVGKIAGRWKLERDRESVLLLGMYACPGIVVALVHWCK